MDRSHHQIVTDGVYLANDFEKDESVKPSLTIEEKLGILAGSYSTISQESKEAEKDHGTESSVDSSCINSDLSSCRSTHTSSVVMNTENINSDFGDDNKIGDTRSSIGSDCTSSSDRTLVAEEDPKCHDCEAELVMTDDDASPEHLDARSDSKKDSGFGSQGILKVGTFQVIKSFKKFAALCNVMKVFTYINIFIFWKTKVAPDCKYFFMIIVKTFV